MAIPFVLLVTLALYALAWGVFVTASSSLRTARVAVTVSELFTAVHTQVSAQVSLGPDSLANVGTDRCYGDPSRLSGGGFDHGQLDKALDGDMAGRSHGGAGIGRPPRSGCVGLAAGVASRSSAENRRHG